MRFKLDQFPLADRHSTNETEKYLFFFFHANIDEPHRTLNFFIYLFSFVELWMEWLCCLTACRASRLTGVRTCVRLDTLAAYTEHWICFLFHFLFFKCARVRLLLNEMEWSYWVTSYTIHSHAECTRKTGANPSVPHNDRMVWVNESGIS